MISINTLLNTIDKELINYLEEYNGEIPILLKPFTNPKKHRQTLINEGTYEEVKQQYQDTRKKLLQAENKEEFRETQLTDWLRQNNEFLTLTEKKNKG